MNKRRQQGFSNNRSQYRNARKTAGKSTLILLNKPYGVLSQFTDQSSLGRTLQTDADATAAAARSTNTSERQTLADYVPVKGVYPAGRLDRDSEGLLLLTNDGGLQSRIAEPRFKLPKSYYAQVEGEVSEQAIDKLMTGVELKDGLAGALQVTVTDEPDWLWSRQPPVRYRKTVPDSWINIVLTEGRNRQVRRMTAAVGLPTLRLIRYAVGEWTIDALKPGEWRKVQPAQSPSKNFNS